MLLQEIRGHNPVVAMLKQAVADQRIASGYLFEGPSGVGKRTTALALAKARLCPERPGKGCHHCRVCQRIDAGNHPDVRLFRPRDEGHRNIQIQTLREDILPVAQYAPYECDSAFLIFEEADVCFPDNHPETANALLKTLEEPRPGVTFILLAERPDRLLDTIRSRCQRVRFGRLAPGILEHVLDDAGIAAEIAAAAIALADGRADRALALSEQGVAQDLLNAAMRVDAQITQGSPGRLMALSEELARGDELQSTLQTLVTFYRDVAVAGLGMRPEQLSFRMAAQEIRERARTMSPAQAAERVQKLGELGEALERNANPQIALDALLLELA